MSTFGPCNSQNLNFEDIVLYSLSGDNPQKNTEYSLWQAEIYPFTIIGELKMAQTSHDKYIHLHMYWAQNFEWDLSFWLKQDLGPLTELANHYFHIVANASFARVHWIGCLWLIAPWRAQGLNIPLNELPFIILKSI